MRFFLPEVFSSWLVFVIELTLSLLKFGMIGGCKHKRRWTLMLCMTFWATLFNSYLLHLYCSLFLLLGKNQIHFCLLSNYLLIIIGIRHVVLDLLKFSEFIVIFHLKILSSLGCSVFFLTLDLRKKTGVLSLRKSRERCIVE